MKVITIDLLSIQGCKSIKPTIGLINKVANQLDAIVNINEILITTNEEAAKRCFFGSPTLQIAGHDIDPKMRFSHDFGLG